MNHPSKGGGEIGNGLGAGTGGDVGMPAASDWMNEKLHPGSHGPAGNVTFHVAAARAQSTIT